MASERKSKIVVGVDGSAASHAALQWAYAHAMLTGSVLHAVHTWLPAPGSGVTAELPGAMIETGAMPSSLPPTPTLSRALRETQEAELEAADQRIAAVRAKHQHEAERTLDTALRKALGEHEHSEALVKEVVEGHAEAVLLDVAADADLLVLGCRGRSAMAEAVLGSVSRHCARHAPCPVVIVPAGAQAGRRR